MTVFKTMQEKKYRAGSPSPDCEPSSNISPQVPHGRGTQFLRHEPIMFSPSASWGLKLPFYFLQTLCFFIPLWWAEKAKILAAFPSHTCAPSGFSQAARTARSIPGVRQASWSWAIWNSASSLATQGLTDSGSQHLDRCYLEAHKEFHFSVPLKLGMVTGLVIIRRKQEGHGSAPGVLFLVAHPPSSLIYHGEPWALVAGWRPPRIVRTPW